MRRYRREDAGRAFEGWTGHKSAKAGTHVISYYLPEKNPFIDEMTNLFHIPREAVLGEPETLYPEYRKKIQRTYVHPDP